MLVIPNTTTVAGENSVGFTTFPPEGSALTPYVAGFLVVANASAFISVRKGPDAGQAQWTPYALTSPTLVPISTDRSGRHNADRIFGVKFLDGLPGTHAQVFGALFQAGEAGFVPTGQFLGTISSGGAFTPAGVLNPTIVVQRTTPQSINSGVATPLAFTSRPFLSDPNSVFQTFTGTTVTLNATGVYLIFGVVAWAGGAGTSRINLLTQNAVVIDRSFYGAPSGFGEEPSVSGAVIGAVGDVIGMTIFQDSGGALNANTGQMVITKIA